ANLMRDRAETGQVHRHREPRQLPDRGDDDGDHGEWDTQRDLHTTETRDDRAEVPDHVGGGQPRRPELREAEPVEEPVEAEAVKQQVDARLRVEHPPPGDAGNDEGERVWKEKDVPEDGSTE